MVLDRPGCYHDIGFIGKVDGELSFSYLAFLRRGVQEPQI